MEYIDKFTTKVYPVVLKEVARRGYDPEIANIITKQLAVESDYGRRPTGKNNLSGTKWYETMGDRTYTVSDRDSIKYADFSNLEDQVRFHISNIENIWGKEVFKNTDIDSFVKDIHTGDRKYSGTDPKKYANTIKGTKSLDKSLSKFVGEGDKRVYTKDSMEKEDSSQWIDEEKEADFWDYIFNEENRRRNQFMNTYEDSEDEEDEEDDFMAGIDEDDEEGEITPDGNTESIFDKISNIVESNRIKREQNIERATNVFETHKKRLDAEEYFKDGGEFDEDYEKFEKIRPFLDSLTEDENREYFKILEQEKILKRMI